MKLNRMMTFGVLALTLSAGSLCAQENNTGGEQRRNQNGGGGGRNWDPAQMQQRMMERTRETLGFTNDLEWSAVEPLVKKVMDARREVGFGGMGRMFGGNRGGGGWGQANPEQEALQKALDDNAPAAQIKDLLAKYKASQKAKQAKLEAAQADLKKVLTTKQEAQAVLLQLVN